MQFSEAPVAGGRVESLEEIDPQLVKDIEEAWEYFDADDYSGRKLDTEPFIGGDDNGKAIAVDWLRQARAYARLRPAGRLVISGSPVKATAVIAAHEGEDGETIPAYKVRFILMEWSEGGDNGH
jgi:hypothetical protein